jgi:DNA (cytosine-5)-methyltransferase 1
MTRPLLLDLFCGAGGAAMGYHRAGFDVVGVDCKPQKRYPFPFYQADALEFLLSFDFPVDAIHASPPCQRYAKLSRCRPGAVHPDLLDETRELLVETGLPWVIENVGESSLLHQPSLLDDADERFGVTLCGSMFGLRLYRHRLFESNVPLVEPVHPRHQMPTSMAGHWVPGTVICVADGGSSAAGDEQKLAMGIDWMTRKEITQAIPPAYTEYMGQQLLSALCVSSV